MTTVQQVTGEAVGTPARSLDLRRVGRTFVLTAWTAFFAWLYFSGQMSRYLGPRTYWVVPFGAIALGLATLAHLFTLRSERPRRPSWGEIGGWIVLLVPMLAILAVPSPDLGALAASRKTQAGGIAGGVAQPEAVAGVDIRFLEISYAEESEEYADAIGATDGKEVKLTGFVSEVDGGAEGTFGLARFYVSCCAADAIPYTVAVDPSQAGPGTYERDTWLDVTGSLERREENLVVVADSIEETEEPENPYLY
jgi:putative membrane protein